MNDDERKPDRVTLTFATTVSYDYDAETGRELRTQIGELGEPLYVVLWCEGEYAGEYSLPLEPIPEPDRTIIADVLEGQGFIADAARIREQADE